MDSKLYNNVYDVLIKTTSHDVIEEVYSEVQASVVLLTNEYINAIKGDNVSVIPHLFDEEVESELEEILREIR